MKIAYQIAIAVIAGALLKPTLAENLRGPDTGSEAKQEASEKQTGGATAKEPEPSKDETKATKNKKEKEEFDLRKVLGSKTTKRF